MTEEEAKQKLCPFSFSAVPVVTAAGRGAHLIEPTTCRGSACMAWDTEGNDCALIAPNRRPPLLEFHHDPEPLL